MKVVHVILFVTQVFQFQCETGEEGIEVNGFAHEEVVVARCG